MIYRLIAFIGSVISDSRTLRQDMYRQYGGLSD
jgi:hypothetical protein